MKSLIHGLMIVAIGIALASCSSPSSDKPETLTVVNLAAISGVTAPVTGATPVTTITETAQYTGTVTWNGSPATFAFNTEYIATITLTAKAGFTLTGVAANSFTVEGATATNAVNSGVVTAAFPSTAATISLSAISGVSAPVTGATPVSTITETAQYTGTVAWSGTPETFAAITVYTATITLTPKAGFTLTGVAANSFTVDGASTVTNSANSGVVAAVFPSTSAASISLSAISGVSAPVAGATPVTTITETAQYSGTVVWSGTPTTFAASTVYTATITLTAKAGYTVIGVAANSFTVAGASATNAVNSGVVTVAFPITPSYVSANIGNMMAVAGGTFNNGAANMTVSSFRMSQHEITVDRFVAVTGLANPSSSFTSVVNGPIQNVNWYHALVFCNKLSVAEGLTPVYSISGTTNTTSWGAIPTTHTPTWNAVEADWSANGYRLPTEAEWQFAARGGNSSNGYTYAGSNTVGDVAWYDDNSGNTTHTVGTKAANELGLYDMSGNVCEWCWDRYGSYPGTAQTDYRGAASGTGRVWRGGCWDSNASGCAVAYRNSSYPDDQLNYFGFRVVRR